MQTENATVKTEPVRESEIRSALLAYMSTKYDQGFRIQEEFRLERGGSRNDVAAIGARLIGYEIKSDLDTFTRFSNQIHAYNRVFDEIYLVCGESNAKYALNVIPSWWGLIVAGRINGKEVTLEAARVATTNVRQDPFSLASLLWKEEALAVLGTQEKVLARSSSHVLWDRIAQHLSIEAIKSAVTESLLRRVPN